MFHNRSERQNSSRRDWIGSTSDDQPQQQQQSSIETQVERDSLEELREEPPRTSEECSVRTRSPQFVPCPSPKHFCPPVKYCRVPSPTFCCGSLPPQYYYSNMQMDFIPYCCHPPYNCDSMWMRTFSEGRPSTPRRICHSPSGFARRDSYEDSRWYKPCEQNVECEDLRDKIRTLENDKQNLILQVNVLTEQIDVQSDKLQELESELRAKKKQLTNSEDMLQQEIMSRASLENGRLELLTELSSLRLQLAASEQKRLSIEEKCKKLENELLRRNHLSSRSTEFLSPSSTLMLTGRSSPEPASEFERLRKTLESVMEANQQKEKKINDLRTAVGRYKNLQDVLFGESPKSSDISPIDLRTSQESLLPPSPYGTGKAKKFDFDIHSFNKPPPIPRSVNVARPFSADLFKSLPLKESSTTMQNIGSFGRPYSKTPPPRFHSSAMSRPPSFVVGPDVQHPKPVLPMSVSEPWESTPIIISQQPSFPPNPAVSYQSLYNSSLDNFDSNQNKRSKLFSHRNWFKKGKRSNSTPELAQCEIEHLYEGISTPTTSLHRSSLPPCPTPPAKQRQRGLRKLFGRNKQNKKFRPGESGHRIEKINLEHLGWSPTDTFTETKEQLTPQRIGVSFSGWNTDTVVEWMDQIGLGMYHGECKKWIKSGDQLLKATNHDLEKELKMKNTLHRKKLRLALQTIGSESDGLDEASGRLDYHWVIRWLDDIGLPQYKDAFAEARIDGRVLHYLTVEDMITLKVTNMLHFTSVKRGIQMLRKCKFDPCYLIRRSVSNEEISTDLITLWTNHRIMEWLKTVDLSEYAPNLRGSGVHGALMVFENGFNGDLLASLLNIPSTKTLLRRHLSLRFKELMGPEVMQQKRDAENKPGFMPLASNYKIKAGRRSHFRLSFRNKPILDMEDFVCPLDMTVHILDTTLRTIPFQTDLTKKENTRDENISSSPVTDTSV